MSCPFTKNMASSLSSRGCLRLEGWWFDPWCPSCPLSPAAALGARSVEPLVAPKMLRPAQRKACDLFPTSVFSEFWRFLTTMRRTVDRPHAIIALVPLLSGCHSALSVPMSAHRPWPLGRAFRSAVEALAELLGAASEPPSECLREARRVVETPARAQQIHGHIATGGGQHVGADII